MILHYLARSAYGSLHTFTYGPYPDNLARASVVAATDYAVRCSLAAALRYDDEEMAAIEGLWEVEGDGACATCRALSLPLFSLVPRPTILHPFDL